jgi:hypothetical protein
MKSKEIDHERRRFIESVAISIAAAGSASLPTANLVTAAKVT